MTRTTRFPIDCAAILPLTAVVFWRVYRPDQSIFDVTGLVLGRDFVNVWIGGGLFAAGRTDVPFNFLAYREAVATWLDTFAVSGVLPDGVRETDYLWAYPPTAGLLAESFSHLPYLAAYATWSVLSVGLLALAVAAADGTFRRSVLPRARTMAGDRRRGRCGGATELRGAAALWC